MEDSIISQIIPIIAIISIFVIPSIVIGIIIFTYHRSKSQERLAMIEKGLDISEIYKLEAENKNKKPMFGGQNTLRQGFIILAVGLGLMFGHLLAKNGIMEKGIAIGSMIPLFVGIAYISYYFFFEKNKSQD
jgi:hypothetical protein